jgi:hypothetical protein
MIILATPNVVDCRSRAKSLMEDHKGWEGIVGQTRSDRCATGLCDDEVVTKYKTDVLQI